MSVVTALGMPLELNLDTQCTLAPPLNSVHVALFISTGNCCVTSRTVSVRSSLQTFFELAGLVQVEAAGSSVYSLASHSASYVLSW